MFFSEPFTSADMPLVQLKSVMEEHCGETDVGGSSKQIFKGSHIDSPEGESVVNNTDDIKTADLLGQHEESEVNVDVSLPIADRPSSKENGKETTTQIAVQNAPVDESQAPDSAGSSSLEYSNGIESKETDVSAFISLNSTPISATPTITSVCTSETATTTVRVASASTVSNMNNITTTSPVVTLETSTTTENNVEEIEKRVSDTRQDLSSPMAGSPQNDDAKNTPLSQKCRIPVRLGEPLCSKSSNHEVNDLLSKPSTFTQDKPSVGNSIFAPTPQRLGCNSPTSLSPVSSKYVTVTPRSPTSVSRTGTKIPSLLPSISHGAGKGETKSQPQNSSLSSFSEKMSPADSKFPSPSLSVNHGKPDVSVRSVLSSNWSVSETDSSSETQSGSRIPQPGFYSSSPLSHQSSKRGSLSSQSSSSSRPGSIAPLSNTSVDCSASPVDKEGGYNCINKPRFSATDHNLNISSKIPTASSLSSSHLNPMSGFTSFEGIALHGNSKLTFPNEQSPLVSKIPTPTSPTSARLSAVSQRLFSTPASEGNQRMNLESPGRQTKTWMFGPHKNATVVSASSSFLLHILSGQVVGLHSKLLHY
jgi:hypothetical protein